MTGSSRGIKVVALFVALGVHGWVLTTFFEMPEVQMEGGATATDASLGNSFADLAAGVMTAEAADEVVDQVRPQESVAEPPAKDIVQAQPATETVQDVTPPQTDAPMDRVVAEPITPSETSDAPTEQTPVVAAQDAVPLSADTPLVPVAPTAAVPQDVAQPITPETAETLEALQDTPTAISRSLRPQPRSKAFEEEHAPEPPKVAQPKQKPAPKQTTRAQPKGNAEQNATTGSATGTQQKTKSTAAGTGQSKATGQAVASNYPGQVMKRISRVPRPRVGTKGTAVVAFRIASNGGLAAMSLAQSSGSAKLDQAALKVIRRAAPFPPPPQGARRSFSIKIKGR